MAKVYTQDRKFEKGTVATSLEGKNSQEKHNLKCEAMAKIKLKDFSLRGFSVHILSQPQIVGGLLSVSVAASKDGNDINVDNPLLYKNPPIMIPDGTFYKETMIDVTGELIEQDLPNMIEDPEGALKEIIVQTLGG